MIKPYANRGLAAWSPHGLAAKVRTSKKRHSATEEACMLPLHYLADEMNWQRHAQAERLRPGRRQAAARQAARRASRPPRQALQTLRKAFQLRA